MARNPTLKKKIKIIEIKITINIKIENNTSKCVDWSAAQESTTNHRTAS